MISDRWFALVLLAAGVIPAAAQGVARTPDGKPDLQGTWTNGFATPLERPRNLGDQAYYSDAEVAAFEKGVRERPGPADPVADPEVWWERATRSVSSRRTSMVTDPADGRIPALTAQAQQRMADVRAETRKHPDSGPEDRSLMERCIVSPAGGPVPMLPGPYNNNYQFVQTRGYVIIVIEMIHDVRIVRMDGSPHVSSKVRQWLGDSTGRWEGDTLVVDTKNFTDRTRFHGADENLHVMEKFTRTGADTLLYQFTIDDPTAFVKPWTAEIPLGKSDGLMYEFSCHEGNLAMANMLNTARLAEKKGK